MQPFDRECAIVTLKRPIHSFTRRECSMFPATEEALPSITNYEHYDYDDC